VEYWKKKSVLPILGLVMFVVGLRCGLGLFLWYFRHLAGWWSSRGDLFGPLEWRMDLTLRVVMTMKSKNFGGCEKMDFDFSWLGVEKTSNPNQISVNSALWRIDKTLQIHVPNIVEQLQPCINSAMITLCLS